MDFDDHTVEAKALANKPVDVVYHCLQRDPHVILRWMSQAIMLFMQILNHALLQPTSYSTMTLTNQ